jgi:hypothetical protein
VLGQILKPGISINAMPYMMGYCHSYKFLIEDLTVEEHLIMFTEVRCQNQFANQTEYNVHLTSVIYEFHVSMSLSGTK